MPIDPNIILAAGRQPQFDPMASVGKAMQLKSMMDQDAYRKTRQADETQAAAQERQIRGMQITDMQGKNAEVAHARQVRDAASQAIQQIKDGNTEPIFSKLDPEARAVAEEWYQKRVDNKRQQEKLVMEDRKGRAQLAQKFNYNPAVARIMFGLDDDPKALDTFEKLGGNEEALKKVIDSFASYGDKPDHLIDHDPTRDLVQPTTGAIVRPGTPKPDKPAFQSKSVLLDGKPAEVSFDPSTGRYVLPGQQPDRSTWEPRADGTPKGAGYFGPLKRADGRVESEMSVGVNIDGKDVEIPTLVPTLTPSEVHRLITLDPAKEKVPDAILKKATAFAQQRMSAGQSPFAAEGEAKPYYPQFKRAGDIEDVTARVKPIPPASAGGAGGAAGGLEPDAVEYTATQYRILGPSGIPTRIEGPDRVKILNTAARQAKALGQSPAQAVQKQAAYKSDAASLTKMRTMSSSAEAFETKAIAQADIVRELSAKVSRTQYPIINRALLAGKVDLLGDTNAQLLANAVQTFGAEYAKIIEGSTGSSAGSSDAARRASARLIDPSLNKGTVTGALDLMQREMRLTIQGYDATINHITDRMGGAPPEPAAPAAAPATTTGGALSYDDYLKSRGKH